LRQRVTISTLLDCSPRAWFSGIFVTLHALSENA
jgi:hypothetical protein